MTPLFNTNLYRKRREHVAEHIQRGDGLTRLVEARLMERLGELHTDFPNCLISNARAEIVEQLRVRSGTRYVVHAECAPALINPYASRAVLMQEEAFPFAEQSFDLVISFLSLHLLNDVPGALAQMKKSLKPGGVLLAHFWGGETLFELRHALMEAEMQNGVSPRVHPMIDVKTAGALVQRAGFSLPVADSERIIVLYDSTLHLMRDLKQRAENSILLARNNRFISRGWCMKLEEKYRTHFAKADEKIPATYELISLFAVA